MTKRATRTSRLALTVLQIKVVEWMTRLTLIGLSWFRRVGTWSAKEDYDEMGRTCEQNPIEIKRKKQKL